MGTRDPRVDDYVARAADFARPILEHLREVVHRACPEVVETLRWRMPSFDHEGILCGMAAFKRHGTEGPEGAGGVRGLSPQPPPRVRRVDRRGEARGDPGAAAREGAGVDPRREAPQREGRARTARRVP